MIAWVFQVSGILLGAHWAYAVLGWGGYWGWDPVENASLAPVADRDGVSAFRDDAGKARHDEGVECLAGILHFLAVHSRNACSRAAGVVSSVHAFAQSRIGNWFVGFIAIVPARFALAAYLKNRDYLTQRESAGLDLSPRIELPVQQLASAGLLPGSSFWHPLSRSSQNGLLGNQISVGPPFFNKVNIPIGAAASVIDGNRPASGMAKDFRRRLEAKFRLAAGEPGWSQA